MLLKRKQQSKELPSAKPEYWVTRFNQPWPKHIGEYPVMGMRPLHIGKTLRNKPTSTYCRALGIDIVFMANYC